jgi:hypothetical protein
MILTMVAAATVALLPHAGGASRVTARKDMRAAQL